MIKQWNSIQSSLPPHEPAERHLEDVDWEETMEVYDDAYKRPMTRIRFKDRSHLDGSRGQIITFISSAASRSIIPGPEAKALIALSYQEVAKDFEKRLSGSFGFPYGYFQRTVVGSELVPPKVGTEGRKFIRLWWSTSGTTQSAPRGLFEATFDLSTGYLHGMWIADRTVTSHINHPRH